MPRFCPGCGETFDSAIVRDPHELRLGAVCIYCFECGTNWYIRNVGSTAQDGLTMRDRVDFIKAEML